MHKPDIYVMTRKRQYETKTFAIFDYVCVFERVLWIAHGMIAIYARVVDNDNLVNLFSR